MFNPITQDSIQIYRIFPKTILLKKKKTFSHGVSSPMGRKMESYNIDLLEVNVQEGKEGRKRPGRGRKGRKDKQSVLPQLAPFANQCQF